MDYQKRFADYLRNQSPAPKVTPSVTGSVYQNRFADYLRNQSPAPSVTSSVTDNGTGNVDYAARFADWIRRNRSDVTEAAVPSATLTQTATHSVTPSGYGGYMPSLTPAHTRGNGYMGYGLETKTPESAQTSGAWRGLPAYASKAMGYLQEAGQYGRDFSAGMGIEAAMRGQTDSGGSPSAKYRTYLDLMTPEERSKAQSLSGSGYEKLGQYVNSLNLESRFQSGESDKRKQKAEEYETVLHNGRTTAKQSDSSQGRLIASWVTGNSQYAARDYQGTDPGPAPEKMRFLTKTQRDTIEAYSKAGDFQAVADYYGAIEWDLNAQQAQRDAELEKSWVSSGGGTVAASAVTSGALNSVSGIPAYGALLWHNLKDRVTGTYTPVDYNSDAFRLAHISSAQQEAAQEWMNDKENLQWADDGMRHFLSNIAYSGASSAVTNLIQLYAGGAMGLSGKALGEFVTVEMGLSSAGQSALQNLQEGQSAGDALANSTVNGLVEYGTEHMFISDYIANLGEVKQAIYSGSMKDVAVKLLKTRVSRAGAEALEEVVGNIADQTWDALYNGENSEWNRRTQAILDAKAEAEKESGRSWTPEKKDIQSAREQAFVDLYVQQSVDAALSAALSTLLMDGVPAAVNIAQSRANFAQAAQRIRSDGNIQNEIDKGKLWKQDSMAHRQALKVEEQLKKGTAAVKNHDLGRLAFLNGQEFVNLMGAIGESGDKAAVSEARAILFQSQDNPTDKITVGQMGVLQSLLYTAMPSEEGKQRVEKAIRDFNTRIGNIDPDGQPLASFSDFQKAYRQSVNANATQEDFVREYRRYLTSGATVSVDGERMNIDAFWERTQAENPNVTREQAASVFENLLRQQNEDGLDAGERVRQARQRGEALQRESLERSRKRLEQTLREHTSVKGLTLEREGMTDEENAYIDRQGVVHLNANRVTTESAMQYVLGHELVHSVKDTEARARLVDDILNTAQKVNGVSAQDMEALTVEYQNRYQKHESELAKRQGRTADTISESYAREELGADMMRGLMRGQTLEKLAGTRPGWVQRMLATVRSLAPSLRDSQEARTLQELENRFVEALTSDAAINGAQASEATKKADIPAQKTEVDKKPNIREDTHRTETTTEGVEAAELKAAVEPAPQTSNQDTTAAERDQRTANVTRESFERAYREQTPDADGKSLSNAWERFQKDGATVYFRGRDMTFPAFWNTLSHTDNSTATREEAAAMFARLMERQENSAEERFSIEDGQSPTYQELIQKKDIPVIRIDGNTEGLSFAQLQARARQIAEREGWYNKPFRNHDTGLLIFIRPRTFTHSRSGITKAGVSGENTIFIMEHFPELIENAVLTKIDPPKNPNKEETRVFSFFAATDKGQGPVPVKLTVKEYETNKQHLLPDNLREYYKTHPTEDFYNLLYDVKAMELVSVEEAGDTKKESNALASGSVTITEAKGTSDSQTESGSSDSVAISEETVANIPPDSTISIQELLSLVNDNFSGYVPKSAENSRRYSITPEFADWFEKQTGERLNVSGKFLDAEGKPVYDATRTVDDRAGVLELARQNRELNKKLEYWKGQTRLTDSKTKVLKNVAKVSETVLKAYDSILKPVDIQADMAELANLLIQGADGKGAESKADIASYLEWTAELQRRSTNIASQIVKNARVLANDGDAQTYREIKKAIRAARISYDAEQGDIADFNDFRRHNFGRMTLAKDGRSVDTYWAEWQERFGYEYFPSEVISTADMLLHISGLLDSFEPIYENPHSAYMAQAITACSNDILDSMMNAWQENFTAADRQRANEEAAAARMSDLARKAIRHERELGERRLRAFKDDQQQRLKDRRQQQAIRDERERLLRLRKRLTNMRMVRANQDYRSVLIGDLTEAALNLTGMDAHELAALLREHPEKMNPQDDEYDPEFLRKKSAEWASSKYGEQQERERTEEKTARELTALYNTNRAEYNRRMREWREGKAPVERKAVTDLSPEEIKDLTIVLQAFEHELRTADRLLETEDRRRIAEQGHDIIEHVLSSKGWNGGAVSALLAPERWARRVTGYAENDPLQNAMRALAQGQEREHDYLRRAYETVDAQLEKQGYDAKKRKALKQSMSGKEAASDKNLISITGYDPTATKAVEVKITKGMRVALYLAGKNQDNVRHIANGGIIIPNVAEYQKGNLKNAYKQGAVRIRLAAGDIAKIVSGMTADEKAFADAVSYYFNSMSKFELADVQERLMGWSNMDTPNYFPINTSEDFTKANYENLVRENGTISKPGWSKSRIHGENPIYLRDANLVLEQAIRQHAKFVGLAIPIRNMNKLMNMTEFTKKGDTVSSVMEAIGNVYGDKAQDYLVKLMDDLQRGRRGEESYLSQLLAIGRSAYASSVLALNLSVAIKQTASYPTAAAVLGVEPLMKALKNDLASTVRGKADLDLIAAYTSHLWYRSQGFSTQEMGDLTNRNQSLGEKLTSTPLLNIIQAMDVGTTTLLWKASEYYVEDNFPELKDKKGNLGERRRGESQFYQKVAEVYNQVIEETQPNYSVMQRPRILRSNSDLEQALTMFKTQPFQNFNILYDALSEWGARKRDYTANPSAENEAARKKAGKKAALAIASQAASSFLFAFMQYGWDWFRRKDDKYKDEDGNASILHWLKGMGVNMAQNGFGMLPFGSELFSIIGSWTDAVLKEMDKDPFFETTFYGFEVGLLSALNDTVQDTGGLIRSIVKVQQAMDSDSETRPDWRDLGWNLYKAVRDYSQFAGLPIDNLRKELWAGVQQIAVGIMGETMGEYALLEMTADKETDKKAYYDLLFKTGGKMFYPNPEGDNVPKNYRVLYQRMLQDGFDGSDIRDKMKDRWTRTPDYLKKKSQYVGLLTGTALASPVYARLDETRREKLTGYIQTAAKYEMFRDYVDGYQATNSEKWIVDALVLNSEYQIPLPDLIILRAGISGIESLKKADRKGKEVTIDNSEGLQIMESAYRLFPEMEQWDSKKRRAVLEWLGVGKTLLRYNSGTVSAKLERMRRSSSPSS